MHFRIRFWAVTASLPAMALSAASVASAQITPAEQKSVVCNGRELPPAQQQMMKSAYRGRVLLQGRAKADEWLHSECGASGETLVRSAPAQTPPEDRSASASSGEQSERNCRMVMRPVAGIGGAMTMTQVPECD